MFKAHGSFEIEVQGRVLRVKIIGTWNYETAVQYKHAIEMKTAPLRGSPWAIMTNLDDWELFTPDCYPVISDLIMQVIEAGLAREAVVCAQDGIKTQLFKAKKPDSEQFKRAFFTHSEPALQWLKEQGFE